jgi:hypothetical protein
MFLLCSCCQSSCSSPADTQNEKKLAAAAAPAGAAAASSHVKAAEVHTVTSRHLDDIARTVGHPPSGFRGELNDEDEEEGEGEGALADLCSEMWTFRLFLFVACLRFPFDCGSKRATLVLNGAMQWSSRLFVSWVLAGHAVRQLASPSPGELLDGMAWISMIVLVFLSDHTLCGMLIDDQGRLHVAQVIAPFVADETKWKIFKKSVGRSVLTYLLGTTLLFGLVVQSPAEQPAFFMAICIAGFYKQGAFTLCLTVMTRGHVKHLDALQQDITELVAANTDAADGSLSMVVVAEQIAAKQTTVEQLVRTSEGYMRSSTIAFLVTLLLFIFGAGFQIVRRFDFNHAMMLPIFCPLFVNHLLVMAALGDRWDAFVAEMHAPVISALQANADLKLAERVSLASTTRANCWTLLTFEINRPFIVGVSISLIVGIIFTFADGIASALISNPAA